MALTSLTQDFITRSGLVVRGTAVVTSSTSQVGALQVNSGAAIAKNIIVGTTADVYGATSLHDLLTVSGETALAGLTASGNIKITTPTAAINASTGALVVAGGAGIGGDLHVTGTIYNNGIQILGQVSQLFTASAGQTSFTTLHPFTAGTEQVFANGIQLISSEYAITDSTIILSTPRRADDSIRIIAGQSYSQLPAAGIIIPSAPASLVNFDVMTQSMQYYTDSSTNNFTLNIRSNNSTTLNSAMSVGQTVDITVRVTNGAAAHYPSEYQIDGVTVVPQRKIGTSSSSGMPDAVDVYAISIIKLAANTYKVFLTQSSFQ